MRRLLLHCCFLGFTVETCTAYVRNKLISIGEESTSFGLKAEFETVTVYGIF